MRRYLTILRLTLLFGLLPNVAQAYIGPGAGLGMLDSLIAVAGAILVALFGLILLPITMLRKRLRIRAADAPPATPDAAAQPD